MSEKSETVREVCAEMQHCKAESSSTGGCNDCRGFDCRDVREFADRILAAYERDVEDTQGLVEDNRQLAVDLDAMKSDNDHLRAALKPVLNIGSIDALMNSDEWCVSLASTIHDKCFDAVRETQRVIRDSSNC